jgi:tetratricopeptide (TPR) repeat protein
MVIKISQGISRRKILSPQGETNPALPLDARHEDDTPAREQKPVLRYPPLGEVARRAPEEVPRKAPKTSQPCFILWRMPHTPRRYIFLIAALAASVCSFGQAPLFFPMDTTGCDALRRGNFRQALEALWSEKTVADSAYWNFKKGVAHFGEKDFDNALSCFSYCARKDSVLRAVSYEFIGDVENARSRTRDAVESYLRAQKDTLDADHYQAIRAKIAGLISAHPLLIDTLPFLSAWKAEAQQGTKEKKGPPDRTSLLDSLVACGDRIRIDSVLASLTDSVGIDDPAALSSRLEALRGADSLLSTKRIFRISQIALQAKAAERALAWFSKASARPDFIGTVPARQRLYVQAFAEYGCSHYSAALELLLRYKENYGPLPDLLLAVARSYHRLDQDGQTLRIYEQFIRLYPRDSKIQQVLWSLAWEYDLKGDFEKAIATYRKITLLKKNATRAPDALLRIGLCHYKAGRYGRACSTFIRITTLYPEADCALASHYWRAQCALSLDETEKAKNQLMAVVRFSPTDYYAFRARDALSIHGDTTVSAYGFNTAGDFSYARQWLDSVSSDTRDSLSERDSGYLEICMKLALAGCPAPARYYLESLESRYPGNLRLQFDIGMAYSVINDPRSCSRIGRRLVWRVPPASRDGLPAQIYSLSYPFAFFDYIKQTAASDTVDPFLVLGIIRQESVFNPAAVSRAGAVGLMQLMPFTARKVAAELAEPFSADSLTSWATNIRYGSHYLKKLLDQFQGNMVQAIAGYNGGPQAIAKWFEQNKKKNFDLFIEDIGYYETRGYVKKVLANYWTYKLLARTLKIS